MSQRKGQERAQDYGEDGPENPRGKSEATETQSLHKALLEALNKQNALLEAQTNVLRSVDDRLGRIERQGLPRGHLHQQQQQRNNLGPAAKINVGSWKFVESQAARQQTTFETFGEVDSEGTTLTGESTISGYDYSPTATCSANWGYSRNFRKLLVVLEFNNHPKLPRKSGTYCLHLRYNSGQGVSVPTQHEAIIIIGEIEFNSTGFARAKGADWDKLLAGKRQTELPGSHSPWILRKISEPWVDGDVLTFRIDTNENTVILQRGDHPEIVLWNALTFTNRECPDFLRAYAYAVCGVPSTATQNDPYEPPMLTILAPDASN